MADPVSITRSTSTLADQGAPLKSPIDGLVFSYRLVAGFQSRPVGASYWVTVPLWICAAADPNSPTSQASPAESKVTSRPEPVAGRVDRSTCCTVKSWAIVRDVRFGTDPPPPTTSWTDPTVGVITKPTRSLALTWALSATCW